jgi:hypothetical protein
MCKRKRFPLEWGGDPGDPDGQGLTWRANFAAANCYEGAKESCRVPFGPLDQHRSLSNYCESEPRYVRDALMVLLIDNVTTLAGTRRVFRLREVIPLDEVGKKAAQTFDIPLSHNSVLCMQYWHGLNSTRFNTGVPRSFV